MEFIEKFRANAKRATMVQSRIKAVEKMDAEAPEAVEIDPVWRFSIPNAVPLGPPIIAVNDVSFDYNPILPDGSKKPESEFLLQQVNFGITLTSKIAILGANGTKRTRSLHRTMLAAHIWPFSFVRYGKDDVAEPHYGQTQAHQRFSFNQPKSSHRPLYSAFGRQL